MVMPLGPFSMWAQLLAAILAASLTVLVVPTWAGDRGLAVATGPPRALCVRAYAGPLASDAEKAEPTVVTQPYGPVRPLEGSQ